MCWPLRDGPSIHGVMAYDYDTLYGETRNALGAPTSVFVTFFDAFDRADVRVLDVGCGQGRDALFIARKGHRVVGVDLSPNGIADMMSVATQDGLAIEGVVADISTYTPDGLFDVVLIDRTLHMLGKAPRLAVLARLLDHVTAGGWVLIADEPAHIPDFAAVIAGHSRSWHTAYAKRGYVFVRDEDGLS
ncbi:MAG: class I SAM-dependent methyltransferase [Paracoccaceae bacterium]